MGQEMRVKSITVEDVVLFSLFIGISIICIKEGVKKPIRKNYITREIIEDTIFSQTRDAEADLFIDYETGKARCDGALVISEKAYQKLERSQIRRAYARYRAKYSQQNPLQTSSRAVT